MGKELDSPRGFVNRVAQAALVGLIRFYQHAISPFLGSGSCRYEPTCSEYAADAIRDYGVFRGTILAVWRILRCNPFGGHGWDPPRWFTEPKPESDIDLDE